MGLTAPIVLAKVSIVKEDYPICHKYILPQYCVAVSNLDKTEPDPKIGLMFSEVWFAAVLLLFKKSIIDIQNI